MVEILLEERETQSVNHYCVATDDHRYDFSVIYSNHFYGKAMVVSLQTGKMVLMCQDDIENDLYWAKKLGITGIDINACQSFFQMILNHKHFANQY
ncbi:DUF3055 domain-containing protein [Bacillus sp. FJAT-29790]|uniref:SAV0927 family protein n=1 Tax=Bacillus sp. FJAT-29790 TaxID=1895002 RepID=UPI001C238B22|nr:SAV0927 family protein [Bacillus sp. FJAT-29790]MBU8879990.1 DUF3055 domain-containing protein [Bacillus sp. FJAT-29790]